jgi:predicted transposase/invertase (TIGR01784 family)
MKKFQDLTFADHYMFEKVLQNKDICKELLERLLKIKIAQLEYPEIEKTISPYYETRGVRLDVYVKDCDKVFDIELQNFTDLLGLRTRYYQSMIDADNLIKGEHYSDLPQSFIIFICTQDPFGKDLPIYTFQNRCNENTDILLEDKTIKKFFNANSYNKEEDVEIKAFLEYICKQEPVDNFTDKISTIIDNIKQQETNKREYESMNIHDQDTFRRGKQQGIQEKAIETAKKFLAMGLTFEQVAEGTGLPLETVEELAKDITATQKNC